MARISDAKRAPLLAFRVAGNDGLGFIAQNSRLRVLQGDRMVDYLITVKLRIALEITGLRGGGGGGGCRETLPAGCSLCVLRPPPLAAPPSQT